MRAFPKAGSIAAQYSLPLVLLFRLVLIQDYEREPSERSVLYDYLCRKQSGGRDVIVKNHTWKENLVDGIIIAASVIALGLVLPVFTRNIDDHWLLGEFYVGMYVFCGIFMGVAVKVTGYIRYQMKKEEQHNEKT